MPGHRTWMVWIFAQNDRAVFGSGLQVRRFTDLPPQNPTQFLPTRFHALSTNFHEKRTHSNSAPPRTPTHFHELPPTFHELPPTFHELPPTFHELPPTFHELPRTFQEILPCASTNFHELPPTFHELPRTSTHFPRTSTNFHALSTKFLKESLQHWPCENGFVHFVKNRPRPLSKNHFLPAEPVLTGFARLEDLAFCSLGVPVSFLLVQPLDTQIRPTANPPTPRATALELLACKRRAGKDLITQRSNAHFPRTLQELHQARRIDWLTLQRLLKMGSVKPERHGLMPWGFEIFTRASQR